MLYRVGPLLCLMAGLTAATGQANSQDSGLAPPDPGSREKPLVKSGAATLSVLFWDIYESELFTPGGRYQSGIRPLRLVIRYLRAIASEALVQQTEKEWRAQGRNHPLAQQWLARLAGMWPDIEKGDTLTLELDSEGAARFLHNGRELGSITDPEFGTLFAGIWLAPDTTRPALRQRLIGEAGAETQRASRNPTGSNQDARAIARP